jgi:hypothetical protein
MWTKHWQTQFHKGNSTAHKNSDPNTVVVSDFNTSKQQ